MGIAELKTSWKGKEIPEHNNRNQEKDGTDLDLKINPDFEKLIPPLSRGEEMDLQKSLRNEGCRDALIIWDGTIIDGHNRYKYCKEKGIAFRIDERHFKDEATAKVWIIDNQLARRNLTNEAKIRLESKRKDILSDEAKERKWSGKKAERDALFLEAVDNNEKNGVDLSAKRREGSEKGKVSEHIAESAGTGSRTVERFHYIEKHAPEKADALCRGKYDEDGNKITTNSVYNDLKEKERKEELFKQGKPIGKYAIAYVSNIDVNRSQLLDLKEFMQVDSLLFMWSSVWSLQRKTALLNELGFEYIDAMFWDFVESCNSACVDNHHMFLLIGVKGDTYKFFLPKHNKLPAVVTKNRENIGSVDLPIPPHEEFKALIQQRYPDVTKLDYFGSQAMDGWEIHSLETPHIRSMGHE